MWVERVRTDEPSAPINGKPSKREKRPHGSKGPFLNAGRGLGVQDAAWRTGYRK
jgi:hypothetical protein